MLLESDFYLLLLAFYEFMFFSNHRIAVFVASIGAFTHRVETAIVIITDVSGSCLKQCLSYLIGILQRSIRDQLPDKILFRNQNFRVLNTQSITHDFVDSVFVVV